MSEAIETFRVEVDDSVLEDLHNRLARTRFPDQFEGGGWDAGMSSNTSVTWSNTGATPTIGVRRRSG